MISALSAREFRSGFAHHLAMAKDLSFKPWHLVHGAHAEQLAGRYLESRGLIVIARNVRFKVGEIDLVCLDQQVLVIVEVRLRRGEEFGGALGSINAWKQRKLIRATQCFLQRATEWSHLPLRFDVIAITGLPHRDPEITWIKQAFSL